jgi:hypothetical protein
MHRSERGKLLNNALGGQQWPFVMGACVQSEASEVRFAQPQIAWLEIPGSGLTTGAGDQMSHRLKQDLSSASASQPHERRA